MSRTLARLPCPLDPDHDQYEYHYDYENCLTSISYEGSGSTLVALFAYDALGRMIASARLYDGSSSGMDEHLHDYFGESRFHRDQREWPAIGKASRDARVRAATCPKGVSVTPTTAAGQNAPAEYDQSENLSRRYIHGTNRIDERAVLLEGQDDLLYSYRSPNGRN